VSAPAARPRPSRPARRRALAAAALLLACAAAAPRPAAAETVQQGGLRVSYQGALSPTRLPRSGAAPISVTVGGRISTLDGSLPPPLRTLEVAINGQGRIDPGAVPVCPLAAIQPASSAVALAECRASLVGEGTFAAQVAVPEQSPFPSAGRLLAFNGRHKGRPAILAHVYGTEPLPTSFTMALSIAPQRGTFATVLRGSLPDLASSVAYVTEISLTLGATSGPRSGYLAAGCPAPAGFPGAVFPLLRAGFGFQGGRTLASTLTRSCEARGRARSSPRPAAAHPPTASMKGRS
jgi:hypothetical protein